MPIHRGNVTSGTRRNLIDGLRQTPMRSEAVDAVLAQSERFAQQLVDVYCEDVAEGEVGDAGTAQAGDEPILGDRPPRVLLYGRVQSGKTVGMILTAALCLDNGFRVVVVLTSDNVALVHQTAERFKALDGPRVFTGTKDGGNAYDWEGQEEQLRDLIATDGVVLVCPKNASNLPQVMRFLQQLDAATYPVLIMDDEADAATPDTTMAARSAGKPGAPDVPSTINRLVIENTAPRQEGFSLGEILPHSIYVQVTATPYVLLLQTSDAELRPTASFLLEPGAGYCGGEVFFGTYDPADPETPPCNVVVVSANEAALISRRVPEGLARSIDFFILSACARAAVAAWPAEGFKHLSHTSVRVDDHDLVANHILVHLNGLRTEIRDAPGGLAAHFALAYEELRRSVPAPPPLETLVDMASAALRQAEVIRINSRNDVPTYGPRLNCIVGGNILGRGLTIDDLLVTYYIREAKTSQMDTVWQHARMFGYREPYIDYVRIYLPHRLAVRFKRIHEAEEALRNAFVNDRDVRSVLIRVPSGARATRPNALEAGAVEAIPAGRDQIHPDYLRRDPTSAAEVLALLREHNVPIGVGDRQSRVAVVPCEAVTRIIANVAVEEDDPGLWQDEIAVALLSEFVAVQRDGCPVYVREVTGEPDRTKGGWFRGRLSGPEIALLRAAAGGQPALALLYRGQADAPDAWYPTLVLPQDGPTYVFSAV